MPKDALTRRWDRRPARVLSGTNEPISLTNHMDSLILESGSFEP